MALNENTNRAVLPHQVVPLIQWNKLKGCVVLCLGQTGELNHLVMSSITVEELSLLTAQLNAHLNSLLQGSLVEGLPYEGVNSDRQS